MGPRFKFLFVQGTVNDIGQKPRICLHIKIFSFSHYLHKAKISPDISQDLKKYIHREYLCVGLSPTPSSMLTNITFSVVGPSRLWNISRPGIPLQETSVLKELYGASAQMPR